MIRGTTAQFRFETPYDFSQLDRLTIIFWQDGNTGPATNRPLPITKYKTDCRWSSTDNQIIVSLEPEETARFFDDRKAKVQMFATTTSNIRFGSDQQDITVYPAYSDDVWEDVTPPSEEGDGYLLLDAGQITG